MNILVTGGAGFVGTNLIKCLLVENNEVVSIDNYHTGKKENHLEGCTYIRGDVNDIESLISWKPDIVYHLAAIARIQPSFKDPEGYFIANANATLKVAKFCSNKEIPLVYAGSSSHHSGKFKNPYTFSKDVGEDIVRLFQMHYGLRASIARFYNVYGPYQLLDGEYTTLIGRWINNLSNNIPCEVYGDGNQRRDFTHVSDIVDALALIVEKQAYGYEFELGRGKNYSVNEIAQLLNIQPNYLSAKKGEAETTLNTSDLAKQVLGWNPTYDLEDYLKQVRNENNL